MMQSLPNHATLVNINNPFAPFRDREVRHLACAGPLRAVAPRTRQPFIILRNGMSVLRRDWDQPVERGDIITVVILPQGGKGGSNPLSIILMLAVMWVAPFAAGQMFGTAGLSMGAMEMVIGGIKIAGMMLVNALIPPPKPPSTQQAASLAAPSPTYNLQAQGNSARIDAAIPAQYGRMMAYPDLAAMPYAEYAGNEQYLFQLFCLGQGEYDIEAIRIEDTPISSFEEIEYEIIPPDASVTLFPSNVVSSPEVSGQEAPGILTGATYSQSGTTVTVNKAAHGFVTGRNVYLLIAGGTLPSGGYTVATAATDSFTVTAAASATTSGNTTIQTIVGPFVASAATTAANTVGIDIILPRALYYANDTGGLDQVTITWAVDVREIDDDGLPVGSWYTAGSETLTLATNTPQRYSYRYGVASGRYEARMRRTDTKQTDSKYGHELAWGGLRAYLPDLNNYGQVTLIAMRMRASNNLSQQASRKVNVICTRKLRTWNPTTGWSAPVATRSIAWAFADAAQNQVYGGRLADARLDLAGLYALDATWTARNNHFDARFDNTMILWEGLTKIAQVGRAKPFMQGGILYVARDQSATLPVALFSMRNIERGSFSVEYITPTDETADAVDVAYFDNVTWSPRRVPAKLPGSAALRKAKVELFGATDRQHCYEEGMYIAAANRYRRKLIKFTSEMESFIPAFLDPIAIQHDMPQWGQHGETTAVAPVQNKLIYSEEFDNAAWIKTELTVAANGAAAPNNSITADKLIPTTVSGQHLVHQAPVAINPEGVAVIAVYAKAGEYSRLALSLEDPTAFPVTPTAEFDLSTGEVHGATFGYAVIDDVGDGLYRCLLFAYSATEFATEAIPQIRVMDSGSWSGDAYSGDGASGLYVWGASYRPSYAGAASYVKTTTSARVAKVLTLTEPLTWASTGTHYIGLRKKDGSLEGPIEVTWAGENAVACMTDPTFTPYTGSAYERTHIAFGWGETWRQLARVISVIPRGLHKAEIVAINEDPNVHTADQGVFAPVVSSSQLPNKFTAPEVKGLTVRSSSSDINTMLLAWQAAAGADHYLLEQSSGDGSWTRVGDTTATGYAVPVLYGSATLVRVAAVGISRGPWVTVSYASGADYMWVVGDDAAEMWSTGDDADAMW